MSGASGSDASSPACRPAKNRPVMTKQIIKNNHMIQFKKIVPALLSASVALSLTACGDAKKNTNAADSVQLVKVELKTVYTRTVPQTFDFTATVEANVTNNIAPAMGARIQRIYVEVGDAVHAGQRLAQMDPTSLLQAKSQLENLQVEFNRVDELYKVGGASKSEWDARKMQLDVARTSYNNLATNTTLTSPISGVVTSRNYDSGDMYGMGKPLLVIEQITPVKMVISVSESLFKEVKKGMPVDATIDVYGDEVFKGKVSLVYPTIDAATRTFPVEITLPNADRRIRPGMFARVTMTFGTADHVVVPDLAVVKQSGSGDRYVYVYKDGTVSYNKVELGRRLDAEYEVISGLSDGDQVVVAGQSKLFNGSAVEVVEPAAPSGATDAQPAGTRQ